MSDDGLQEQYRTVFLDEGSGDNARRSETVTVQIGEHELDVEVKALTIHEFESTDVPSICYDNAGQLKEPYDSAEEETLRNAHRVAKCARIPETGERIFTEPSDFKGMIEAPYNASGWFSRLINAVLYVHGFRNIPPEGMRDQRLVEIAEAAEELERVAQTEDELDGEQVAEIASRIGTWARYLDHGVESDATADEGKAEAH